jgi:hypothetical protein
VGIFSKTMRATLLATAPRKHRCNTVFTTFSLLSTKFYLSEAVQCGPPFSELIQGE